MSYSTRAAAGLFLVHAVCGASDYASDYASSSYGDDHGDDGGHHYVGIFSTTSYIRGRAKFRARAVICAVLLIAFTVAFELMLHQLEHRSNTFYREVLSKITKELMILGLISFSLFIIEDSSNSSSSFTVDHDWVLVFHFVHYLIFFIGASFILQSITLCVSNSRLKEVVWKSRGASADTLRGQYDVLRTRWEGRIGKRLTAAFMWLTSPAERIAIRLFSHAFIKMYKLPRTFLFPMYLQLSLDKHTLNSIDINISSWVALIFVLVADDYARVFIFGNIFTLTCCGYGILALQAFIGLLSLITYRKILGAHGVHASHDLVTSLDRSIAELEHESGPTSHEYARLQERQTIARGSSMRVVNKSPKNSSHGNLAAIGAAPPASDPSSEEAVSVETSGSGHSVVPIKGAGGTLATPTPRGAPATATTLLTANTSILQLTNMPRNKCRLEYNPHVPFGNLWVYEQCLDITNLALNCYVALLTLRGGPWYEEHFEFGQDKEGEHFEGHKSHRNTEVDIFILAVMLLPAIIGNIVLQPHIMYMYTLIMSLLESDTRLLGETIEYGDGATFLVRILREKIAASGTSTVESLKEAFQRYDADDSGAIDYSELKLALEHLGLFLTPKQFLALVRMADPDRSGQIEMAEWLAALAPEQQPTAVSTAGGSSAPAPPRGRSQSPSAADRGRATPRTGGRGRSKSPARP